MKAVTISLFCLLSVPVYAQEIRKIPNLYSLQERNLSLAEGKTYAYTVDTPAGQGLVNTGLDIPGLLQQLKTYLPASEAKVKRGDSVISIGKIIPGDLLVINDGTSKYSYNLDTVTGALAPELLIDHSTHQLYIPRDIILHFKAGQRTPDATVEFTIPAGIKFNKDLITADIIGRGPVLLNKLATTSSGRSGKGYPWPFIGEANVAVDTDSSTLITLKHLDLRPDNGADIILKIPAAIISRKDNYLYSVIYCTSAPVKLWSGMSYALQDGVDNITDFERIAERDSVFNTGTAKYTMADFRWSGKTTGTIQQSLDSGRTWTNAKAYMKPGGAYITGLQKDTLYYFRLRTGKRYSNTTKYFTGAVPVTKFLDSSADHTNAINKAIAWLHEIGGGTLLFPEGEYHVRTVHLLSNVYLYLQRGAVIKALRGADAPETTWFSDKAYRSGLSPLDHGPYDDPENYLTKQDVGHHYFHNAMFFAERQQNIKIVGEGRITGDGNLVTGDKVMNNAPDNRADKMFSLKLCKDVEIGGVVYNEHRCPDLWYDTIRQQPVYLNGDTTKISVLHIDQAGHFALLATGTAGISVHDTYFGVENQKNARDIYDFMGCNRVTVTNIFSRLSSDDIVKPGSDCSLGFTRPSKHFRVRNIIGDTNCNLFQIGSETADDISDICVDNIMVLGANKAGFSISTNDGAHIHDIHLNCGHTNQDSGFRSLIRRSATPFFISVSNRARILGANAAEYTFTENDKTRKELLVQNVSIGRISGIRINNVDVDEVYGGSAYGSGEWKSYSGKERKITSIVAGYKLPDSVAIDLPDGRRTSYIEDIVFRNVHFLYKGGNAAADTAQCPPELGVGQYNAVDFKVQPAYGLWVRHAKNITLEKCQFGFEQPDYRWPVYLDDTHGAILKNLRLQLAPTQQTGVRLHLSTITSAEEVSPTGNTAPQDSTAGPIVF